MELDLKIAGALQLENTHPIYILSGSGSAWYYSDIKKGMIRVPRGSECLFCEEDPENIGRYIVQIGYEVFSVPVEDLLEVGWN